MSTDKAQGGLSRRRERDSLSDEEAAKRLGISKIKLCRICDFLDSDSEDEWKLIEGEHFEYEPSQARKRRFYEEGLMAIDKYLVAMGVSRCRLSDQFREQLGSLGESLAKHTRYLNEHLEHQEQFLIQRREELEVDQQQLLSAAPQDDDRLQQLLSPFLVGGFQFMTVRDLRKFCTKQGLRRVWQLRRPELLKLLNKNQLAPPPLPIEKVIKKLKRAELEAIATYFIVNVL